MGLSSSVQSTGVGETGAVASSVVVGGETPPQQQQPITTESSGSMTDSIEWPPPLPPWPTGNGTDYPIDWEEVLEELGDGEVDFVVEMLGESFESFVSRTKMMVDSCCQYASLARTVRSTPDSQYQEVLGAIVQQAFYGTYNFVGTGNQLGLRVLAQCADVPRRQLNNARHTRSVTVACDAMEQLYDVYAPAILREMFRYTQFLELLSSQEDMLIDYDVEDENLDKLVEATTAALRDGCGDNLIDFELSGPLHNLLRWQDRRSLFVLRELRRAGLASPLAVPRLPR